MNSLSLLRAQNRLLGAVAPGAAARRMRRIFMKPMTFRAPSREDEAREASQEVRLPQGLRALRWGQAAGGPRVLALHGWQGRPTQFHALVEPIVSRGGELVALWGPAHGPSAGEEAHPFAFARALEGAADALGPFDAVVGHSMGGGAAAMALAQGLPVPRAVLFAPPTALEGVLRRFGHFVGLSAGVTDRFIEVVSEHVGVPASDVTAERLASQIDVPVLVVHDEEDRDVPFEDGRILADALPGGRLLPTRGLGHRRILDDPEVVSLVLDYLLEEPALGRDRGGARGSPDVPRPTGQRPGSSRARMNGLAEVSRCS